MQNGTVTLCTMLGLSYPEMNIHNQTLNDIWNSDKRIQLLLKMLSKEEHDELSLCKTCNVKNDFAYKEDLLDDYTESIIKRTKEHYHVTDK